ncbi:MAG: DNA-3-methyladenine glycosylase [Nanoarchaeota archaeon]|nr:DNA-3-methyladenine glycosylase [Nanoarchaeota archaeon]
MKLNKEFYLGNVLDKGKDLLGKILVHNSKCGEIKVLITDVEIYPANVEEVGHGTKRTPRTEILFSEGGFAYVYSIYGIHNCFAIVFGKKGCPDEVLIRGAYPLEGIDLMKKNYGKVVRDIRDLTNSPAKLCKSLGVDKIFYGEDLTGNRLYLEENYNFVRSKVIATTRKGLNKNKKGFDNKYRFYLELKGIN